ncbi:MAG TPA: response regulator [Terriglobales bacterium]|jgi:CheY-like chemotaxis protein|nr:response regulator [Terriglobales bacterium]
MANVLCVDCNPALLEKWTDALQQAGHHVHATASGKRALEIFVHANLDIVILDYRAREVYGGEVALRMRALRPDVPILMLCGAYWWPPEAAINLVNGLHVKADGAQILVDHVNKLLQKPVGEHAAA